MAENIASSGATIKGSVVQPRNRTLDVMRIVFALLVLYSHAYELQNNNTHHYIFERFGAPLTWGSVGVDGFFLLSGCLIVDSWRRNPNLKTFLTNRALRILPGYFVAVLLSFTLVGWLAPGVPNFFHHLGKAFFLSLLVLYAPLTANVFPDLASHSVNGSLWTISYEARCYLIVAFFGVTSLLKRPWIWLVTAIAFFIISVNAPLAAALSWSRFQLSLGFPSSYFRFIPIFMIGGCFSLFRNQIPLRGRIALLSFALLLLLSRYGESFFALFFGYLLFYFGSVHIPLTQIERPWPDISYGMYLYGWPVECFTISLLHTQPVTTFLLASTLSVVCGILSWHFVERPALRLKRGSRVELASG